MQAKLTDILGLQPNSIVSIDAITSFSGAYKDFLESLYQIGVTPDTVGQKERDILNVFMVGPRSAAVDVRVDDSNTADQGQLPVVSDFSGLEIFSMVARSILTENVPSRLNHQ